MMQVENLYEAIEHRTVYLIRHMLLAVEVLFAPAHADTFRTSKTAKLNISPELFDFEQYMPQWADLVPPDPTLKAGLIRQFANRYDMHPSSLPNLAAALGFDDAAVGAAYLAQFGEPLDQVFAQPRGAATINTRTTALKFLDLVTQYDIEREMQWHFVPRGEYLFREGEPGDSLYIIVNGTLSIELQRGNSIIPLAERGPGTILGEMAVLTEEGRSADARALRDTELLRFSQTGFNNLVSKHPHIMLKVTQVIIGRYREALGNRRVHREVTTVALVPLNRSQADTIHDFAAALRAHGSTLHLSSQNVDAKLGEGTLAGLADEASVRGYVGFLNEQEANFRFVLYETDTDFTNWTERCLLQADHILLLADGDADPQRYPIEAAFGQLALGGVPQELVLLYPPQTPQPAGGARWLQHRHIANLFNIRRRPADMARLARRVAGHSVGLVMGGGGLRAFAHGGVLKAMEELNIPIDYVGGTSAGAVVAGIAALELPVEEAYQRALDLMSNLVDYTLPLVSLARGKNLHNGLVNLFGDLMIEDLWVKYYAIATNASRAQMVVMDHGPIRHAIRASASLPGVYPPLIADNETGDLLVDGAVFNNVPTDVMDERCDGVVIACDVSEPNISSRRYNHPEVLSGWHYLFNRANPFQRNKLKGPTLARFLSRLTVIGSLKDRDQRKSYADVLITPAVSRYPMFDIKTARPMYDLGYEAALQSLSEWKAANPDFTL